MIARDSLEILYCWIKLKARDMLTPIIAANWKMYKTIPETEEFIAEIIPLIADSSARILVAVPFTSIRPAVEKSANTPLIIGAQNMNDAAEGAFTGEIAAKMLVDVGAKFVIIGHSERRRIFGEDDQLIARKLQSAIENGLQPLLCIGETLSERENEEMEDVLATQLSQCLEKMDASKLNQLIIAYEPVWAIGTGISATAEKAQEAHQFCREYLTQRWGAEIANKIPILYGGSVKPETASSFLKEADINGLLVGSASLNAKTFAAIVDAAHAKI